MSSSRNIPSASSSGPLNSTLQVDFRTSPGSFDSGDLRGRHYCMLCLPRDVYPLEAVYFSHQGRSGPAVEAATALKDVLVLVSEHEYAQFSASAPAPGSFRVFASREDYKETAVLTVERRTDPLGRSVFAAPGGGEESPSLGVVVVIGLLRKLEECDEREAK